MKKIVSGLIGAFGGILFCLGSLKFTAYFEFLPYFPTYGGESDFEQRILWFIFGLLPCFSLLGGWVGLLMLRGHKQAVYGLLGAASGTVLYFLALHLFSSSIGALPNQVTSNRIVIASFVVWLLFAGFGIFTANKIGNRQG